MIFRALVNIPKEQLKGDGPEQPKRITVGGKPLTMAEPLFTTEAEVTRAIATGKLTSGAAQAYADAKEWQRQVKAAEQKTLLVKSRKKAENGKYRFSYGF